MVLGRIISYFKKNKSVSIPSSRRKRKTVKKPRKKNYRSLRKKSRVHRVVRKTAPKKKKATRVVKLRSHQKKKISSKTQKRPLRIIRSKTRASVSVKPAASVKQYAPVAGEITHFFSNISVAVVRLSALVHIGDTVAIRGATTNFKQRIQSMQINHQVVPEARAGQEVGMKVLRRVRVGDVVYRES